MAISFPDGFLWGTATAAHQVEGGNWNNDWWLWEHNPMSPCVEPSGDACDHYHRYRDDIRLLAELGFGTYRFSLEWSRIEPCPGEFSRASLDHYSRMIAACHEHGLAPIVTFHHFTTPAWAFHDGGWEEPDTAGRFARYCDVAARHLAPEGIAWACTINEPNIVATMGFLAGVFPPGLRQPAMRRAVNDILLDAHRQGAVALRAALPGVPVGLTLAMSDYQAVPADDAAAVARRDRIRLNMEDVFLEGARNDDFIGVQTYSRTRVGPDGDLGAEPGAELTQMGYEFWPEALEATIRRAWDVTGAVPVLVTENGIGTDDDARRIEYVTRALHGVRACLDDGIDVRGYTYWSAMDNFEWTLGYRPTFGIVAVDRSTLERRPKPSAAWLGAIARANRLD